MNKSRIYRVTFYNQGTIYELYAKSIAQGELFGFLEISDLVFGNNTVVVDPSLERLKTEFSGVKTTFIPMHAVLRIDEVEKEGVAKIRDVASKDSNNIAHFPVPIYTPQGGVHPSDA